MLGRHATASISLRTSLRAPSSFTPTLFGQPNFFFPSSSVVLPPKKSFFCSSFIQTKQRSFVEPKRSSLFFSTETSSSETQVKLAPYDSIPIETSLEPILEYLEVFFFFSSPFLSSFFVFYFYFYVIYFFHYNPGKKSQLFEGWRLSLSTLWSTCINFLFLQFFLSLSFFVASKVFFIHYFLFAKARSGANVMGQEYLWVMSRSGMLDLSKQEGPTPDGFGLNE